MREEGEEQRWVLPVREESPHMLCGAHRSHSMNPGFLPPHLPFQIQLQHSEDDGN